MRTFLGPTLFYAPAALVLAACSAAAPRHASTSRLDPASAAAQPVSRVWFTGASNIRRFTCRADTVRTTLAAAPGATVDTLLRAELAAVSASLVVPVAALDCGIEHMNGDLRAALKAPDAPTIEFRLIGYAPARDRLTARLDGALRVAGVERPLSLDVDVEHPASDVVRLRGSRAIRPSDFGVAPPRRFFGLLRVRDEVTVHFDVTLADSAAAPR